MSSPSEALASLLAALGRLGVPYQIGGSVASSVHGIPRTTLDIDIEVRFAPEKIDEFATDLSAEFYADAGLIREAFLRGRAANLIHFKTGWKFDLFPLGPDEYSQTEFARRAFRKIALNDKQSLECAVASAEDTVLRKLQWYRAGGDISERQWNDLLGICKTAAGSLDMSYLKKWASYLRVSDLLDRLLAESDQRR